MLESIYWECLLMELADIGIPFECDRGVAIDYKGRPVRVKLRLDVLVDQRLVLELKSVEALLPVHKAQLITYLKLTGYPAGLLMNFNETTLRAGVRRLDHPDRYRRLAALRNRQ